MTDINDFTAGIRRRVQEITKAGDVIGPLSREEWGERLCKQVQNPLLPVSREDAAMIAATAFMASADEVSDES